MYSFTQRVQQLESLKRFLDNNQPLMLVVGEEGTGKTNLISQLVADIQIKQRVIRLQGNVNLVPAQLTQLLSHHGEITIDQHAEGYQRQLDQIIQELATHNQACVLIVDDAEYLPIATLAALSHLSIKQDSHSIHLHVILSGKPKLLEKMSTLQTNPRHIQLEPLSYEETFHYIQRCLNALSKEKIEPPPENIIHKIHKESKGAPAAVQHMTREWLKQQTQSITLEKTQQKPLEPIIDKVLWQKHWVKGVSLCLLLVVGFVMWYHKEHNRLPFMHPQSFQHQALGPVSLTNDVRYVSAEREPKPIAAAPMPITPPNKVEPKKAASQPAFTLQLMGGRHLNALEQFVAKHNLQKATHIMTTIYQGQAWYIITYGEFQTVTEANNARKQLPAAIQKLHPWVRSTSTIR